MTVTQRTVDCAICDRSSFRVRFPKGRAQTHRIVQCTRCGLMYANPQELVHSDFFDGRPRAAEMPLEMDRMNLDKQFLQMAEYRAVIRAVGAAFPKRGKLLEIGSNLGVLLNEFGTDGWETLGLEPDPRYYAFAKERFGLPMIPRLLREANLPAASFDAVIMMHVIEHMPDPLENAREIFRILAPGGMLVVETPRYDSLMFALLGRRERSVSMHDHIYFFTTKTLALLLHKAGFSVERRHPVGRTLTLDRLLWNIGLISHNETVRRLLDSAGRRLKLNRIRLHLNFRDLQRCYARKPIDS